MCARMKRIQKEEYTLYMYPKVNTAVSASNVRLAPRPRRNIHQAINYFFPKISKFPMRISQVKNQSRQTVLSQAGEGLRSPYQKPEQSPNQRW